MSITIDPTKRRASPVAKPGAVIGASGGKKVVDMTGQNEQLRREREQIGQAADENFDKDAVAKMVSALTSNSGKPLFGGDPDLLALLDRNMGFVTGEKNFNASVGSGARFGFLGHVARRVPSPILMDNEDVADELFPAGNKTFCVDPSGRMWIHAGFLLKCIKADQEEGLMTLPVINHEHMHIALNHCMRMHNFDPRISNIAKDSVMNPMVKLLYPTGTKFAKDFEGAWGNRPEDKRFDGLSEETVATIMQTEAIQKQAEKGILRIKLLEVVDGKVGAKKEIKAGKGETIDLDHVIVTVEETFDAKGNSVGDKIDTDFDCAICEIDKTINSLRTRKRKGQGGGSPGESSIVDIPVTSDQKSDSKNENGKGSPSDSDSDADGKPSDGPGQLSKGRRRVNPNELSPENESGAFNQNAGHEVSMEKVKEVLSKHGYGNLLDTVVKPDTFDPAQMDVLLESAMTDAQLERNRLGSYYPGAHIDEYVREVVKPALKHRVNWRQRTMEFLQGSGPLLTRSLDEQSILSLLDPADLGMEEDEMPILPGLTPTKPEGRIGVLVDSSGSMDEGRLVEAVSFILALRKSANDMSPDMDVFSADTSLRGKPIEITEETADRIASEGMAIFGRGGTEITGPLIQLMDHARDEQIRYDAILYITDFGLCAPDASNLPHDLPKLMFLGIPADYKASSSVIKQLEEYAEVVCIDKNMDLDLELAASKANVRGNGAKP